MLKLNDILYFKNDFLNSFKTKYYFSSDYLIELIFDYKIQFIESMFKFYREIQFKLDQNQFDTISIISFHEDYEKLLHTFETKIENINKLKEFNGLNNYDNMTIEEKEQFHRKILNTANMTSLNIYILIVIYIMNVVLTSYFII